MRLVGEAAREVGIVLRAFREGEAIGRSIERAMENGWMDDWANE